MDLVELMERYESLKDKYEELENEIRSEEAVIEVTKDSVNKKGKELEEKGIEFSNLKELRKLEKDYEKRIEEQVSKMEEILGEEDDEEDFDEYEDVEDIEIE